MTKQWSNFCLKKIKRKLFTLFRMEKRVVKNFLMFEDMLSIAKKTPFLANLSLKKKKKIRKSTKKEISSYCWMIFNSFEVNGRKKCFACWWVLLPFSSSWHSILVVWFLYIDIRWQRRKRIKKHKKNCRYCYKGDGKRDKINTFIGIFEKRSTNKNTPAEKNPLKSPSHL